MSQRSWNDIAEGDILPPVAFPLSVYRLIVAAGATRDFNSIHHNEEFARRSGAPGIYANAMFLQGMWERVARDYIGLAGTIRALRGFSMNSFNCAGDTLIVYGEVARKWLDGETGLVEIRLWTKNGNTISVGPGAIFATLPLIYESANARAKRIIKDGGKSFKDFVCLVGRSGTAAYIE